MKVFLEQNAGTHFTALTESGHRIDMDGSGSVGGQNQGARPMETVLAGLGGCSAVDVVSLLDKMRQAVTGCRIEIEAMRSDDIPAVFTRIHLVYILQGEDLDPAKIGRAVSLSVKKYCSVTRMLEKTAKISFETRIHTPQKVDEERLELI